MQTPYDDLPEDMKKSDRAEADKMLEIINKHNIKAASTAVELQQQLREAREREVEALDLLVRERREHAKTQKSLTWWHQNHDEDMIRSIEATAAKRREEYGL